MATLSQAQKAELLRSLHTGDGMLVLPNVWDTVGARALEQLGYPAVATTSAGVANALGYQDGQRIRRTTMLEVVGRIAHSVEVPVTADFERGYAESPAELQESITQLIETGVVGLNFEDGTGQHGPLRPVAEQCERIAAVREAAARAGVPLVINARTDAFLSQQFDSMEERIEESATRAAAYTAAGADCIFPIGPGDADTVRALRARIRGAMNVLASPAAASLAELRALGVQRVSFGSWIFRACLGRFMEIARDLQGAASPEMLGRGAATTPEVRPLLRPGPE